MGVRATLCAGRPPGPILDDWSVVTTVIERIAAARAHAAAVRPAGGGFPYLAEALRRAGVTRCHFDVPSRTLLDVTADGSVLHPGASMVVAPTVVARFDRSALVVALRADQAGETTFDDFVVACWRAGVVRYEVDTTARTCRYLGAAGEQYVERYPAVELPPVPEHVAASATQGSAA